MLCQTWGFLAAILQINKDEGVSTASSSQLWRRSECSGVQMDLGFLGMGHRPIFWSGKLPREDAKHTEYKYRNQKSCVRGIWVPQLPSYRLLGKASA